jgi:hypothetical protein
MPPAFDKPMRGDGTAPPVLIFACHTCGKKLKARAKQTNRKVRCPSCSQVLSVPGASSALISTPVRPIPLRAVLLLTVVVVACALYANLSLAVTNRANYRWFPPFVAHVNDNRNWHEWNLGGEYFNIAQALAAGQGFAHPFRDRTGPTAWQSPVLPVFLAALLWLSDGSRDGVAAVIVCLSVLVLIGTGLLVLALARRTTVRAGAGLATSIFLLVMTYQFTHCFQRTHDFWMVLLCLDLLLAGLCWLRPPEVGRPAGITVGGCLVWGVFGGLCAQVTPVAGFSWGMLTVLAAWRRGAWSPLALTLLAAGLTLAPWTIRNYLVLGCLLPMKSNLAFEAYQSQCLQPDGLLQNFDGHPSSASGLEGQEYRALGEIAYLERKREQFWQAVRAHPKEFLNRLASRLLGATLWYVPFNRVNEGKQPLLLWFHRLTHPVPFLALLVLLFTTVTRPLHEAQWLVMGLYVFQLLPYVLVSYYDRYASPLLAVKALLVIWAIDRLLTPGEPRGSMGS